MFLVASDQDTPTNDLLSYSRSNVLQTTDVNYLRDCRYDEEVAPYCPIFRLGDVVRRTGYKFQDMSSSVRTTSDLYFQTKTRWLVALLDLCSV